MGVCSILVLPRASKWQTKWRRPPGVGGGPAHIPEGGHGVPFFSQGEQALPSALLSAPSLEAQAGNSEPWITAGHPPPSTCLPASSRTLPAAPQRLSPPRAGPQDRPAFMRVSTYCVRDEEGERGPQSLVLFLRSPRRLMFRHVCVCWTNARLQPQAELRAGRGLAHSRRSV